MDGTGWGKGQGWNWGRRGVGAPPDPEFHFGSQVHSGKIAGAELRSSIMGLGVYLRVQKFPFPEEMSSGCCGDTGCSNIHFETLYLVLALPLGLVCKFLTESRKSSKFSYDSDSESLVASNPSCNKYKEKLTVQLK